MSSATIASCEDSFLVFAFDVLCEERDTDINMKNVHCESTLLTPLEIC